MSALSIQYFLQLESIIFSLFKSLTQLSLCFTSTCFSLPQTPNAMNLFKLICSIFLRKYAVFIELLPSDAISLCAFLSTKLGIKKLIWLQCFLHQNWSWDQLPIARGNNGLIWPFLPINIFTLRFQSVFRTFAILFHSTIFCTQQLSFRLCLLSVEKMESTGILSRLQNSYLSIHLQQN